MITALTRQFAVDGVSLAWDRWGARTDTPALLLCHGFSGSTHDFALNIEALAESGQVLALDHRGHGRSEHLGALDRYSLDRLAEDLIEFVAAEGDGAVDLLGHSMGGAISLRVTLARPDLVNSLILMDTSGWSFVPQDPEVAALMTGFMASFDPARGLPNLTRAGNPETPLIDAATPSEWQTIKAQMDAAFDPYALKALGTDLFAGEAAPIRARLGEITCPTTVIVGEHDHPFVDQAAELAAEVANGALMVIPGAYHSPQLTHPDEWAAAVGAHLQRT